MADVGRKALADLTNSSKPSTNKAGPARISTNKGSSTRSLSKGSDKTKQSKALSDLANIGKPSTNKAGASRITNDATSCNKSVSKGSEKFKNGSRKPLSDISNSVKPNERERSKKDGTKLNVLAEEPPEFHNHEECLKAQRQAEMKKFLSLALELGLPLKNYEDGIPANLPLMPVSNAKSEDQLSYKELDELPIHSSPESLRCKSPLSPRMEEDLWSWKEDWEANFKLRESP